MQDGYLWSQYSPVAHFHAPSVPQPPTCLKIAQLRDTSAIVKWKKPDNSRSHTNLHYKVYLSASYSEKPVCLGTTTRCFFRMEDLVPNTHYRVGCTAESSMGVSHNNHVLHFSTRVVAKQGPLYGSSENPTSSTLPPRNYLRLPAAPALAQTLPAFGAAQTGSACPSPSVFSHRSPLSDGASCAGGTGLAGVRHMKASPFSPAGSTAAGAGGGAVGGGGALTPATGVAAFERPPHFLPPVSVSPGPQV